MANPFDQFDVAPQAAPRGKQPLDFDAIMADEAMPDNLAPVARSVYQQESGSGAADTSAVNEHGVTGPMQVKDTTFEGLKRNGLIPADWQHGNPEHNARAGLRLIKDLGGKFGNDPEKVAAAYYGGEKAVRPDGTIAAGMRDRKNPNAPTVGEYAKQVTARAGATQSTAANPFDQFDTPPAKGPAQPTPAAGSAGQAPGNITWGDIGNRVLRGLESAGEDTGELVSWIGDSISADGVKAAGDYLRDFSKRAGEHTDASLSPEAKAELDKKFLTDDWKMGDFTGKTVVLKLAESIAPLATMMVPQLGVTKLGMLALGVDGAKVAAAVKAAESGAPEAVAALNAMKAKLTAAGWVGAAAGAAPQSGAAARNAARENVMQADEATLAETPAYQDAYWKLPESMPDDARRLAARKAVAELAASDIGLKSAGAAAVLFGPVGGIFGKVGAGATGRLAAGAQSLAVGVPTMAGQGAIDQYLQNKTAQQFSDPNRPSAAGVPNAVGGGVAMAGPFAVGAMAHARPGAARAGHPEMTPVETDPLNAADVLGTPERADAPVPDQAQKPTEFGQPQTEFGNASLNSLDNSVPAEPAAPAGPLARAAAAAHPEAAAQIESANLPPEGKAPVAPMPGSPDGTGPVVSFSTKRGGSVYTVNGQSTQRAKGGSINHTDVGQKDASEKTVYTTPDVAVELSAIYAEGMPPEKRTAVVDNGDGTITLTRWAGIGPTGEPFGNKIEKRLPVSYEPAVGMQPFEWLPGGSMHVGTEITRVHRAEAPTPAEAAPAATAAKPPEPVEPFAANIPAPQIGAPGVVTMPNGTKIPTRYAVVDASQVEASHDVSGRENPNYPDREVQNRNRDSAASVAQMAAMSNAPDPDRLGTSPTPDAGAPMVYPILDADGNPVLGPDGRPRFAALNNGRTAGLQAAHAAGRARDYVEGLAGKTDHGVSPEAFASTPNAMLVRVYDPAQNSKDIGRLSNSGGSARLSPLETALNDARGLSHLEDFKPNDDGELRNADNQSFIRRFIKDVVPEVEHGEMMDRDGNLSPAGLQRIRNAILAKAYGDSPALYRAIDSLDDNVKNVTNGLLRGAPAMAALKDAAERGQVHPIEISNLLADAAETFAKAKADKWPIDKLLGQGDVFNSYSPETIAILKALDDNSRSAKRIGEFLKNFSESVFNLGDPHQANLFGEVHVPSALELLTDAAERTKREYETAKGSIDQGDLFAVPGAPGDGKADAARPAEQRDAARAGQPRAGGEAGAGAGEQPGTAGRARAPAGRQEPEVKSEPPAPGGKAEPVLGKGAAGEALYQAAVDSVKRAGRATQRIIEKQMQMSPENAAAILKRLQDDGIIGGPDKKGVHKLTAEARGEREPVAPLEKAAKAEKKAKPEPAAPETPAGSIFDVMAPKGKEKEPQLSREGEPARATHEEIATAATDLHKTWKNAPDVEVVKSVADLPEHLRESIKSQNAEGDAEGVFDPETGKVHLVSDNISDPDRARYVVMHEALGHYGLRGVMGDKLTPALRHIFDTNQNVRQAAAKMVERYGLDRMTATEEVLADMAGKGVKVNGWNRLVAGVKQWMRERGIKLAMSDADVRALVAHAGSYVRDGLRVSPEERAPDEPLFSRAGATADDEFTQPKPRASRGPLDAAFRLVAKATGADRLTRATYEAAGKILDATIPEKIKAGVMDDYGLDERYVNRRSDMNVALNMQARKTATVIEKLGTLSRAQSRVAWEWMQEKPDTAAEQAAMAALPEKAREALVGLKKEISDLGTEAMRLGMLSPDAYERNNMAYLHRSYMKYEAELGKSDRATRSKQIRISGDAYKGRGLRDDVDSAQIKAADPDWFQRKLDGKADTGTNKKQFIRFERREHFDESTAGLEGFDRTGGKGKLREVEYWPADKPIPAKYADWHNAGTWEARFFDKSKTVGMWRDFTREEQRSMGVIDEARYAIAKTMQILQHDVETGRMLEWVGKEYGKAMAPAGAHVEDGAESLAKAYAKDTWVRVPETTIAGTNAKKYGKLAGQHIPGPMWNDIRQLNAAPFQPLGEGFAKFMSGWKTAKTALSPTVHVNNIMSNFMMADFADVGAGHLHDAASTLLGKGKKGSEAASIWERFTNSGASEGAYARNEIHREVLEPLLEQLRAELKAKDSMSGLARASAALSNALHGRFAEAAADFKLSGLGDKPKKLIDKISDIYGSEDEFFRLAAFHKGLQEGMTDRQAGRFARDAFLNYQINAPWINVMRQTAFPFWAFTYRAIPLVLRTAAEKPWKFAKYAAVGGALNAASYAALGAAGNEQKEHDLLPEEKQGKIWGVVPKLMRMPWNDANGSPVFLDIRRWVPMGDMVDTESTHSAFPILPSLVPGGPLATLAEIMLNSSQFTGQPITKDTDTLSEKASKVALHLWQSWAPNAAVVPGSYAFNSVMDAGKGKTDAFGREQSPAQSLVASMGLKVGSYPADVAALNATRKYKRDDMEIKTEEGKLRRQLSLRAISPEKFQDEFAYQEGKRKDLQSKYAAKFGIRPNEEQDIAQR